MTQGRTGDTVAGLQIERKTLGRIWSLARDADLSRDEVYAIIRENFGKERMHDLSRAEIGLFMDTLGRLRKTGGRISQAQGKLIRDLAGQAMRYDGNVDAYIRTVCRNVVKKDGLQWCEPKDAVKVTQALKSALAKKTRKEIHAADQEFELPF